MFISYWQQFYDTITSKYPDPKKKKKKKKKKEEEKTGSGGIEKSHSCK